MQGADASVNEWLIEPRGAYEAAVRRPGRQGSEDDDAVAAGVAAGFLSVIPPPKPA